MYALLELFFVNATPTGRVLIAACLSTLSYVLFLVALGSGLWDDGVRATLHAGVMLAFLAVIALVMLLLLALIPSLWRQRHRPGPAPNATLLVVMLIGLGFTALAIPIGVMTTAACVVLMGVLAVGVWLFEARPMVVGYIGVNALIVFNDIGVQKGWWPYAPALTALTYEQGPTLWWFTMVRQLLFVCGWTTLLTLLWLLIGSLESVTRQLAQLSNTDSLTGLANRRAFMDVLGSEIDRQSRTSQPLCVVLMDADHFKRVNDEHGHAQGDKVLLALAQMLKACVRPTDLACRLGGEEFALILPDTRQAQAMAVCTRLRAALASHTFGDESERPFKVTLSMGLAESNGKPLEAVFKQADELLYKAKSAGRDRVCVPPAVVGASA